MLNGSTIGIRMFVSRVWAVTAGLLLAGSGIAATAKLPQRNMTVELRIIAEADASSRFGPALSSGQVVRTQPAQERDLDLQKVFVMNGERATLKLGASTPVQWVKTAVSQTGSSNAGSGAQSEVTWMDAGQGLTVQVRWPGGRLPAVVEVEVDTATLENRTGSNLPSQMRGRYATTVSVPMGEWSTIAVTGGRVIADQPGVYSTRSLETDLGKLVQIRVLAP